MKRLNVSSVDVIVEYIDVVLNEALEDRNDPADVDSYKRLIGLGMDLISTPIQLKNRTFVWRDMLANAKYFIYNTRSGSVRVTSIANDARHTVQAAIAQGELTTDEIVSVIEKDHDRRFRARSPIAFAPETAWVLRSGYDSLRFVVYSRPSTTSDTTMITHRALLVMLPEQPVSVNGVIWYKVELNGVPAWANQDILRTIYWEPLKDKAPPKKRTSWSLYFFIRVGYDYESPSGVTQPVLDIIFRVLKQEFPVANIKSNTQESHYVQKFVISGRGDFSREHLDVVRQLLWDELSHIPDKPLYGHILISELPDNGIHKKKLPWDKIDYGWPRRPR